MQTLDKNAVLALQNDIVAALQTVAAKHGVAIKAGNGTFSGTNATLKLEISVKDANGAVVTKEAQMFKSAAILYGFKPEDLGRTFVVRGKTFTIVGLDRKSHTYPLLATSNGKTMKFRLEDVKRALGIPLNGNGGRLEDFGVDVSGLSGVGR